MSSKAQNQLTFANNVLGFATWKRSNINSTENELAQFKKDVSKLEREISINIKNNRMANEVVQGNTNYELKKNGVVKMVTFLLPKRIIVGKKAKSQRIEFFFFLTAHVYGIGFSYSFACIQWALN